MTGTPELVRARPHRTAVRRVDLRWLAFWALIASAWAALLLSHRGHAGSPDPAAVLSMWALMSVAMMAPTAVPMLATLDDVLGDAPRSPWWTFLSGYVGVWLGFSLLAAGLQIGVSELDLLGHGGSGGSSWVSAGVLVASGAYQFSTLKHRCLQQCQRPMTFLLRFWREGVAGGWSMGTRHGVVCVGCCWLLMLLAFVGGVASTLFMALATLLMVVEKLPAAGRRLTVPLGIALISAGLVVAVSALTGEVTVPQHQH